MNKWRRPNRRGTIYLPDGEYIYRLYFIEMGQARSYAKLCKRLAAEGHVNPKTGNKPAVRSVWYKMWRWALLKENQDAAYQVYNDALRDEGKFMTREEFKKYLDEQAITVFKYAPRSLLEYQHGVY
jgi:hypothetical protein